MARLRYTLIESPHREHSKELIQAPRRRQLTSPSSVKLLNAKILYSSEHSPWAGGPPESLAIE